MSSKYNGAGVSPETFQQIINERIEEVKEKTELKRLYDLKRIQDMKSTEGTDPLAIFPKEIWESIFHLVNPEDRGNLWKLHGVFRDVMKSTHVRDNLFPRALGKIETTSFWNEIEDEDIPRRWNDDDDDDYGDKAAAKYAKVPLVNYLELRGVSKCLRDEADRFLEKDLLDNVQQVSNESLPDRMITFEFDQFEKPSMISDNLDEILSDFEENPKSHPRFFHRSLHILILMRPKKINNNCLEQFAKFSEKILQFLQHAGDQFWYLKLTTFDDSLNRNKKNGGENKLYVPINDWLSLLPNLKWLHFFHACESKSGSCYDFQDLKCQPKLKNLERINLNIRSKANAEAESYYKLILKAHPHVKVLTMCGRGHTYNSVASLKSLEAMDVNFGGNFFTMEKLTNNTLPLKRMALNLNLEYDTIIPLFKFLENFPTLEELKLVLKNATIGGGIGFLKLPNLKEFQMDIKPNVIYIAPINFFFSLQFLLYSKNLTKLLWTCELNGITKVKENLRRIKQQPAGTIGFGGGWLNLTGSNIWKVFPYLEHVETRVKFENDYRVLATGFREYRKRTIMKERVYKAEADMLDDLCIAGEVV